MLYFYENHFTDWYPITFFTKINDIKEVHVILSSVPIAADLVAFYDLSIIHNKLIKTGFYYRAKRCFYCSIEEPILYI